MKNENKVHKKNKKFALFIKTVFMCISVLIALISLCFVTIWSKVKPPDVPLVNAQPIPNYVDMAFIPPNSDEEDINIGDGLDTPAGFTDNDRKEDFFTFLIFGLDEGINTDTIMVASYDGLNKEANIIGIPRDSRVNVRRNVKKINAAYPAGTLNDGGKKGGIEQLKREIKTIIGFIPDFYICVDLDAFVKIIDTVDGIDVYVPFNMWYDDPLQDLYIGLSKGQHHLDGSEAIKFARYRRGNIESTTITDYQRIENQQAVIKAVLDKVLSPANILKIPEFIDIFNENVDTDIKPENMLWLAEQINKIKDTDALSTYTLPTTGTSGMPMYYEYLDKDAIIELVNKTVNPFKKDIEEQNLDIVSD